MQVSLQTCPYPNRPTGQVETFNLVWERTVNRLPGRECSSPRLQWRKAGNKSACREGRAEAGQVQAAHWPRNHADQHRRAERDPPGRNVVQLGLARAVPFPPHLLWHRLPTVVRLQCLEHRQRPAGAMPREPPLAVSRATPHESPDPECSRRRGYRAAENRPAVRDDCRPWLPPQMRTFSRTPRASSTSTATEK
jgi:hypothetical protein